MMSASFKSNKRVQVPNLHGDMSRSTRFRQSASRNQEINVRVNVHSLEATRNRTSPQLANSNQPLSVSSVSEPTVNEHYMMDDEDFRTCQNHPCHCQSLIINHDPRILITHPPSSMLERDEIYPSVYSDAFSTEISTGFSTSSQFGSGSSSSANPGECTQNINDKTVFCALDGCDRHYGTGHLGRTQSECGTLRPYYLEPAVLDHHVLAIDNKRSSLTHDWVQSVSEIAINGSFEKQSSSPDYVSYHRSSPSLASERNNSKHGKKSPKLGLYPLKSASSETNVANCCFRQNREKGRSLGTRLLMKLGRNKKDKYPDSVQTKTKSVAGDIIIEEDNEKNIQEKTTTSKQTMKHMKRRSVKSIRSKDQETSRSSSKSGELDSGRCTHESSLDFVESNTIDLSPKSMSPNQRLASRRNEQTTHSPIYSSGFYSTKPSLDSNDGSYGSSSLEPDSTCTQSGSTSGYLESTSGQSGSSEHGISIYYEYYDDPRTFDQWNHKSICMKSFRSQQPRQHQFCSSSCKQPGSSTPRRNPAIETDAQISIYEVYRHQKMVENLHRVKQQLNNQRRNTELTTLGVL